jgi:hypothetical protein
MSTHDVNWLRLLRIEPVDVHLRREVSSPAPGVAIIDIVTEPEIGRSHTPLHWRVGDWRKPPIDISIRPDTGAFESIQIVFQDEHIRPCNSSAQSAQAQIGLPLLVVHDVPESRYVDVDASVQACMDADSRLLVRWTPPDRDRASHDVVRVSPQFALHLSEDLVVVGIECGPITESEQTLLTAADGTQDAT